MSMINKGIPYFPTPANFFDEEIMELLAFCDGKSALAWYIIVFRQKNSAFCRKEK